MCSLGDMQYVFERIIERFTTTVVADSNRSIYRAEQGKKLPPLEVRPSKQIMDDENRISVTVVACPFDFVGLGRV